MPDRMQAPCLRALGASQPCLNDNRSVRLGSVCDNLATGEIGWQGAMRVGPGVAAIVAALILAGCSTVSLLNTAAVAPSPLCAAHAWHGIAWVRAYRLARVSGETPRPPEGPELARGCKNADRHAFLIRGDVADGAAIAWLALQRETIWVRKAPAGALVSPYDMIASNFGAIDVSPSTAGKCAGQTGRCIIGVLSSTDVDRHDRNWSRETFTAVREGDGWRLIDYTMDTNVIVT